MGKRQTCLTKPSPPPAPRKRPQQVRSQATVDAIVEACLQLLEQGDPDRITTNSISERSGVAKGSLYQYFPDKDAIVAAAFDRVLSREIEVYEASMLEWQGLSLEDSIAYLVDRVLEVDQRLARLHHSFYHTYHHSFDIGAEWQHRTADTDRIVGAVRDRLAANRARLRTQNLDTAAFMLTRGLRGLVSKVIEERPEHLNSGELRDELVSLFQGYLIKPESN
jgi:AcrR family transcriptional regulator